MVEVSDRGGWPQQRDDPVAHERSEHEHVVALVGVPRAPRREVGQSQDRGQRQQAEQDRKIDRPGIDRGATVRGGHAPTTASDGPVRARLPGSISASGGRSSSGRPAAMSQARRRLMAS